ncbi:hypothetical protein BB559_002524 [Furculomyces boomerangus]|uniref:Microsomal glutathione S-transferase 3 n=1 Tax=Furculomyces boomerangus TaxID=61424 RepID=A0A2T9YUL4_9FUNG|nr:hypothetical protein BB559_002524 [Furculomyces boomerangus]
MISVSSEYTYNLLVAALMGAQCFYASVRVNAARKNYNLEYPDMGSGRFSVKLSDKDWKDFNNIMRTHQNYVEQLPIAISAALIGGLYYPKLSAILGGIYILGRAFYSFGYKRFGPSGRMVGAITLDVGLLGMMGAGFVGIIKGLMST